jgi:hypothetical protein
MSIQATSFWVHVHARVSHDDPDPEHLSHSDDVTVGRNLSTGSAKTIRKDVHQQSEENSLGHRFDAKSLQNQWKKASAQYQQQNILYFLVVLRHKAHSAQKFAKMFGVQLKGVFSIFMRADMGRNGKTNLNLKSLKIKEAMSVFHFILLAQNSSDIVPILASLTD